MDAISEAANMVAVGVKELREQVERLTEVSSAHESNVRRLEAENEVLRDQLNAALRTKDLYKGFSVEIGTQLNNVHMLITDVMERSKKASVAEVVEQMPKTMKAPDIHIPGEEEIKPPPKFLGVRRV